MPYSKQIESLLKILSPSRIQEYRSKYELELEAYTGEFLLAVSEDHTALVLFEAHQHLSTQEDLRAYFDMLYDKIFYDTKSRFLYGIDDTVRMVHSNTALVILAQEREMALYLSKST